MTLTDDQLSAAAGSKEARDHVRLYHFPFCPHSRSIRLALAECGITAELVEERPWEWREGFVALNPAGEVPVLETDTGPLLAGSYAISEYLEDTKETSTPKPARMELFPGPATARAEVRRLTDWFQNKLNRDVTRELAAEKIYARIIPGAQRSPDPAILASCNENLRYHLSYIAHLALERNWLAGEDLSFADLAAAAHLSVADYLGDVPWDDFPPAKSWYQRIKSRPTFRPLLADRLPGMPPSSTYADLDF